MRRNRTSLARGGRGVAADAVRALCARGLDTVAFRNALRPKLARVVAFGAYCVNTCDPDTLVVSSSVGDGLTPRDAARIFAIERDGTDVNPLAVLAHGNERVATLHRTTRGNVNASRRMREVFTKLGFVDELRAALIDGDACWGYLHLFRVGTAPPFSTEDVLAIEAVHRDLGRALRTGAAVDVMRQTEPTATGVVLVGKSGRVASVSESAASLLADLDHDGNQPVPHALLALAEHARTGGAARARALTKSGRWLTMNAVVLGARVAIVVEPAQQEQLAALLFRAHGLTPRERDVAALLLRGASSEEIAQALRMRPFTAKDHAKAVYSKVGVNGRSGLLQRLSGTGGGRFEHET
jgi:DNA-binding CsgD family transcriptional regulator